MAVKSANFLRTKLADFFKFFKFKGVGVPIMLAYVYGVVPLSLCRNGACGGGGGGGTSANEDNVGGNSTFRDEEEKIVLTAEGNKNVNNNNRENSSTTKTISKSSFHQRRQSIASFGKKNFLSCLMDVGPC